LIHEQQKNELELKLSSAKKVHFVGIGGISMSALAEILLLRGYKVSGSDIRHSHLTQSLMDHGATVAIGHDAKNVDGADVLVYTAAVKEDNPELVRARELNIPCFERAVLLGVIMRAYKHSIGISGTHGKTTTTSMISQILVAQDLDPTCLVGGVLSSIGGNIRVGSSDYLVTEACEYVDSFLSMSPNIAVVLNVEEDHLDYFKDINHIKSSFKKFVSLCGKTGTAVACGDDKNVRDVVSDAKCKVLLYGIDSENLDIQAKNIKTGENRCPEFDVYYKNEFYAHVALSVPGRHNILNALACCGVCISIGIDAEAYANGVALFVGTRRRFERVGTVNGAAVIDDYAHHPTEIRATLTAARSMGYNKIYCIFQPHTYTRTIAFFDDFIDALSLADTAIYTDIYAAREKNLTGLSSESLAERSKNGIYISSFEDVDRYIRSVATKDDLVITMGAGNVYQIYELLIK